MAVFLQEHGANEGLVAFQRVSPIGKINHAMTRHSHGQVWNDSAPILSFDAEPAPARRDSRAPTHLS